MSNTRYVRLSKLFHPLSTMCFFVYRVVVFMAIIFKFYRRRRKRLSASNKRAPGASFAAKTEIRQSFLRYAGKVTRKFDNGGRWNKMLPHFLGNKTVIEECCSLWGRKCSCQNHINICPRRNVFRTLYLFTTLWFILLTKKTCVGKILLEVSFVLGILINKTDCFKEKVFF